MNIETLILAGGKSSRMGQDKALLLVNNQPLLLYLYSLTKQVSNRVFIITSTVEKYQKLLPNDCLFIEESNPYQGALMAFAEGIKNLESEWIFLLACDLPFLILEEIQFWLSQLSQIEKNNLNQKQHSYIACLPKNEKGWDCLCGFYHRDCLPSLNDYLKGNNRSFQQWLNQENVYPLTIKNEQVLFNCNTPKDYELVQDLDLIPESQISG